jgi:G3E family GTPase
MTRAQPIPVNVITGALGSGKTTLLARLLRDPGMADTAVLINEFGEVGLDHHLLQRIDADTVMLQSGCVCCTIRGDLANAVRDLYERRQRGEIARFRRLVIETTGLADPAPVIYTLMSGDAIRHHFRLGNVITTVDALNGARQLDAFEESLKQAAVADRLVLTKTDLADEATVTALRQRLAALNPAAPVIEGAAAASAANLLTGDVYNPRTKGREVARWVAAAAAPGHQHAHDVNRHDASIHAFCLTFEAALDWTAFGVWLTMLLHAHGENILRVKGILNVAGSPVPVAVHGVQHIVHPPVHLARWPDDDRRSRIVFIVRGLAQADIEASLAAFNGAAVAALAA